MAKWNFATKLKFYYHNKGYFVLLFNLVEDRNDVLHSGHHTINNRPIILKVWSAKFDFHKEVITIIPIWIRLPNLPLNCWSKGSLSHIGSVINNVCLIAVVEHKVSEQHVQPIILKVEGNGNGVQTMYLGNEVEL